MDQAQGGPSETLPWTEVQNAILGYRAGQVADGAAEKEGGGEKGEMTIRVARLSINRSIAIPGAVVHLENGQVRVELRATSATPVQPLTPVVSTAPQETLLRVIGSWWTYGVTVGLAVVSTAVSLSIINWVLTK